MKILKGEEYPDKSPEWHDGFEMGVRAVLAIRCIHHRNVPIMNRNVNEEAECPVCECHELSEEINALLAQSRGEIA